MEENGIWLRWEVTPAESGQTVFQVLRGRFGLSRGLLRRLKREEGVLLNGRPAFLSARVAPGDVLALRGLERSSPVVTPEELPLEVVYEDQDLLVVNKPAGMVAHPAHGHLSGTLANAVAFHVARERRGNPQDGGAGGGESTCCTAGWAAARPGVHLLNRLDRGTSGLVLVAKTPLAWNLLGGPRQHLERRYLAVVHGAVREDQGRIDLPIGPLPGHPVLRAVSPAGQPATTLYRVLRRWPRASLLALQPLTGRTHQLRVHLAALGHPVVGDPFYAPPALNAPFAHLIDRQALHAAAVRFTHPRTGEPLTLTAPLPGDLRALVQALGETN